MLFSHHKKIFSYSACNLPCSTHPKKSSFFQILNVSHVHECPHHPIKHLYLNVSNVNGLTRLIVPHKKDTIVEPLICAKPLPIRPHVVRAPRTKNPCLKENFLPAMHGKYITYWLIGFLCNIGLILTT